MSKYFCEISPENFYGKKSARQERVEAIIRKEKNSEENEIPKFMSQLLGPTRTWKVFKKQQDAIDCCLKRRNGLMCFAFEDVNGRRMFLVAHPKVFWYFNRKRFFLNCNTYEIIQEYCACKLYLDIEYDYAFNRNRNDETLLQNLLKIINYNLFQYFSIEVSCNDILDLDSSSKLKFSHHIIYQIRNTCFQDSYSVGMFIKKICNELREAYENNLTGDSYKLNKVSEKYNLVNEDIIDLFVQNQKDQVKLIVDEGVYTKNRHFRTLGSSKQSKNIPLTLSRTNKYKPCESVESIECTTFLDSLVTFFSWNVDRIIEFGNNSKLQRKKNSNNECKKKKSGVSGIHPQIDDFINSILPKGGVRRKIFFSDTSSIVYEIQGYRYCENIQREHKSNNIIYIVDLQALSYYQKCYDPDCTGFRSHFKPLPEEIRFLFEDDDLKDLDNNCEWDISDADFVKAIDSADFYRDNSFIMENDITDEELAGVVDIAENIMDVVW